MPMSKPIELLREHRKQYASLCYETSWKLQIVWEHIRTGWYGDPGCSWYTGGWKAADSGSWLNMPVRRWTTEARTTQFSGVAWDRSRFLTRMIRIPYTARFHFARMV